MDAIWRWSQPAEKASGTRTPQRAQEKGDARTTKSVPTSLFYARIQAEVDATPEIIDVLDSVAEQQP